MTIDPIGTSQRGGYPNYHRVGRGSSCWYTARAAQERLGHACEQRWASFGFRLACTLRGKGDNDR